jgi:S1-C subfamily serine protease
MASLTPDLARQNNADPNSPNGFIPEVNGVVITRVYPKTPAEKAGLRRLDVVVEINGQQVERADDAQRIIDGAPIGKVRSLLSILFFVAVLDAITDKQVVRTFFLNRIYH